MVLRDKFLVFVMVTLLAVSSAGFANAQDDEGVVSYRLKLMGALKTSMGSINDMLKFKLPYDSKHVAAHASHVSNIGELIGDAFEKEITGDTGSMAKIWQEWDKFIAAADALSQAGADLAKAAEGGSEGAALMGSVRAVGDACKGCHDPYRR
jgi:cytochrome c556